MSGHSKWANIKNRKGAQDEKKGKVFGQLSRLIRAAVKEGGSGDPSQNPTLRTILEKTREANMPKENVRRAIDKGLGKGTSGAVSEIVYEGFGPGGIGMLVTVATDNVNRISSELKNAFTTAGGSMGAPGSVMYMFNRARGGEEGYICITPIPIKDENTQRKLQNLMDLLREIEDVEEVLCAGVWSNKE
ncbi:YebC/PmpR family DNA-binding transcriptional regulator [Patescibacteria group bacterium]|nr:YebC/PmpR family DNA-binding transcriptional regulator [Patescibacteria group bacterium]MBU1967051.1 YebC/PmpR family DNA-binding transcriptional regulator [Patescibacteria group bacterium]MBU2542999.1 YebC/PmpR family DNA-binding transcriptional regulator [Patescibacteria group bacterium]